MSKLLNKGQINLLALNLQKPSAINIACYGNFSHAKAHEFVAAKGNIIELLRPDETGKMISVCSTSVFAVVRSILPFRLAGGNKDYLIIGSDSGKISVSEFDAALNDWKIVHCETFGKTGCRRIVPGQFLAVDPKGRAIMIGALEKQKFVYVMNRDSANRLTISSPQEAHKADTFTFSMCGVDVGFDNPMFACIEVEKAELDASPDMDVYEDVEKKLTYYELDLGLNHVVRKWSETISRTAYMLFTVPGGDDGPSGVIICEENWISFKHMNHEDIRAPIPRRAHLPKERGVLITSGAIHKRKDSFFYVFQSEHGDLFKVTLSLDPANKKVVVDIVISVMDTIQSCNSICISRSGLLFGASEFGNHMLFQFIGMGDDVNSIKSRKLDDEVNMTLGDDSLSAATVAPTFTPTTTLKNLNVTDEMNSLAPITDMLVDTMVASGEDATPQIHLLCGRGNRSSLRVLKHGISVSELAVSELPGKPVAVWTVKNRCEDEYDKYIVVSFSNATLVLSVGDDVQEVSDSGFLTSSPSILVVLLADDALVQVHTYGIRHIRADKRVVEWKTPMKKPIQKASANSRQVVIALAGGQIIYFELDAAGQLMEQHSVDVRNDVCSLDLGEVPEGRVKSPFLAVGCIDDSVQVLSLDNVDLLTQRSSMTVDAHPDSVCLVLMDKEGHSVVAGEAKSNSKSANHNLYLNIGLSNGLLVRVVVDPLTGALSDSRSKVLGGKSIKLFRTSVNSSNSVLALSTRSWLMYEFHNRFYQTPLSYDPLEYASSFASELCPEGMVVITGNTLRIIAVTNLGTLFNQISYPLRYTPRKMCTISTPVGKHLCVIESDHNEYNESETVEFNKAHGIEVKDRTEETVKMVKSEEEEEEVEDEIEIPLRGPLPPTVGKWASCVRIINPINGETLDLLELQQNEAAFSVCTCSFVEHSDETFIVVGVGQNVNLHPLHFTRASIHIYRLIENKLTLVHATEVENIPLALCPFNGRLLVGVGKCLRLYELGKRKLLRKCENKNFPQAIVKLVTCGDRVYVGDMVESVHFVRYKKQESSLIIFADDCTPK